MKRKQFLSSLLAAGAILPDTQTVAHLHKVMPPVIPPALKRGDTIGITSPGGYITIEEIQPAIQQIESWGMKVKVGFTIGKRDITFGGTDEQRAKDLQQMIDDPNVNAIMCARGGYGAVRMVDKVNFSKLTVKPKWLIGFSDITVLHAHLGNIQVASIHSKMCNSFPKDWNRADEIQKATILSIKEAITGVKMKYNVIPNAANRNGVVEGELIGGNLKTIENLTGTKSEINTKNKILFLEDTGEFAYSVDRMFWHLKRSQKLAGLKALIIGGFKFKKDDEGEEFGRTLEDIVTAIVKEYKYPVCFNFPVGHQKDNFAIKCSVQHRLTVTDTYSELIEI